MFPEIPFLFLAVAFLVNCFILYCIISWANRPHRRDNYASMQLSVLILMAKKAGVTDEQIQDVMDKHK